MSHHAACIKIKQENFICVPLLFMSSSTSSTTTQRKNRSLSSRKNTQPIAPPPAPIIEPQQRKRRQIHRFDSNLSRNEDSQNATISTARTAPLIKPQPIPPQPKPTSRRSLKASARAIEQREREKEASKSESPTTPSPEEKPKPLIRKKRKLNTHKAIVLTDNVTPDAIFAESDRLSYREYHEISSSTLPEQKNRPKITLGILSKNNRVNHQTPIPCSSNAIDAPSPTPIVRRPLKPPQPEQIRPFLDLSQHSIIPSENHTAHLPRSQKRKSIDITDATPEHVPDTNNNKRRKSISGTEASINVEIKQEEVGDTEIKQEEADDIEIKQEEVDDVEIKIEEVSDVEVKIEEVDDEVASNESVYEAKFDRETVDDVDLEYEEIILLQELMNPEKENAQTTTVDNHPEISDVKFNMSDSDDDWCSGFYDAQPYFEENSSQ